MTRMCSTLFTFGYLSIILLLASFTIVHVQCASVEHIVGDDSQISKSKNIENVEPKQSAAQTHVDSNHKSVGATKPSESTGDKPMSGGAVVKDNLNCSLPINKNNTLCNDNSFVRKLYDNSGMLIRTMLVLLGVTTIVIIYFVIRAVRLRRRRSKSRKYGVITRGGTGGEMEMEPLGDGDDEDDDYNHR